MSVTKNPAIASLDPESLCRGIYTELYNQFFNAQDRKDEQHPNGVEEGDDTSIRLHNAAYGFAYAIAGSVEGGGSGNQGGILLDYLRKDGGDMSGSLRANYGFEAGKDNRALLDAYVREESAGIRFHEDIDIRGSICFSGKRIIGYNADQDRVSVTASHIDFGASTLRSVGSILVGDSQTGIYITPSGLSVGGNEVYHRGNANRDGVDWSMRNASVSGDLEISGKAVLSGMLRALNGVELGAEGRVTAVFRENEMTVNCNLSFGQDYGIKIGGFTVLGRVGTSDIMVGGIGGDLLLGSGHTNKIKLVSGLMDADADYMLLSPYGAAYFPDSLTVRHNYGDVLLSSYRTDSKDEGITIHKKLRFGDHSGPYLYKDGDGIGFNSFFEYTDSGKGTINRTELNTVVRYGVSTSLFSPQDRTVGSLIIDTQADSILFTDSVETKNNFSINGSFTRLSSGSLFLTDSIYLLAIKDGIKHYGNTYMLGDVSSEYYSSGFAGSGWAVQKNKTTGNATATFDEITVRKRMNVYELQVRKMSASGGSLWISDSFSGDRVEQIQ